MLRSSRDRGPRNGIRGDVSTVRITRQRAPLDLTTPTANTLPHLLRARHALRDFRLRPGIVVRELDPQLASVFALAIQPLPEIALASTRHQYLVQIHQRLANQVRRLFVLAEDRNLQRVVVEGVVHREAQLLIPSRRLPTAFIRLRLLRFLAQPRRAVWILLAHCLSVWQVLCPVHDHHQRPYLGSIHRHVREDAAGMRVGAAMVGQPCCHVCGRCFNSD